MQIAEWHEFPIRLFVVREVHHDVVGLGERSMASYSQFGCLASFHKCKKKCWVTYPRSTSRFERRCRLRNNNHAPSKISQWSLWNLCLLVGIVGVVSVGRKETVGFARKRFLSSRPSSVLVPNHRQQSQRPKQRHQTLGAPCYECFIVFLGTRLSI